MRYALGALGPHEFENMVRALCLKFIGPGITVFGSGPDGGREASYTGSFAMTSGETWSGHTVIQAKFRLAERDPADNLDWLRGQMSAELKHWGDPTSQRRTKGRLPDNLIVVSNVSLSSPAGGGIDTADAELKRLADKQGVPLRHWRVWPAQQLTALLDNAHSVRSAYAGYLTPGDVLGQIAERLDLHDEELTTALTSHVVKEMLQARWVALDAAGQEERDRVNLGRVAVDLPARRPEDTRDRRALAALVEHVDTVPTHRPGEEPPHVLLVGGPGQGKTTLSALLAQLYRVALLEETPNLGREAERMRSDLIRDLPAAGLPQPANRRWPVRVDLAAFAEHIAGHTEESLLRYLAGRISARSPRDITAVQLDRWLTRYPWLVILDGLDEVASAAVRDQVVRAVSDFLVDASSRAADVVMVATTRPQGYADELPADDFGRLDLVELSPDEAFRYADRLAQERHPDDPDMRQHIRTRLEEAAETAITARLMRTPLQVTIMSRLLEGRQRVPQERYALFDAYFGTIYGREANKRGHIAKLLEERQADVAWVHERVALTCQVGAESGEAVAASISREQLRSIARDRLIAEGLEPGEAEETAERIATAALHRLVLLVPQGDGIGFEVRSLQEFMAARALTAAADPDVIDRLRLLVPSAHWRNTWLFAAGHLFRTREWLRSSLIALLREVDAADDLHELATPGSELAGDLVYDGLAGKTPEKNRALAQHALERLQRPPGLGWRELAQVLLQASEDRQTRGAVVRAVENALARGGGSCATALLLCHEWEQTTGPLATRARQLWHNHPRERGEPGMTRLLHGRLPGDRESSSMTLSEYMDALVSSETEAARKFLDLLSSSWVRAVELHPDEDDPSSPAADDAAAVWIVSASATPDLVLTEWALAGEDRQTDSEAGAALHRLTHAIPPGDWHVSSTLRADVQHWLSRRPVGDDLLRAVYG